MFSLYPAARMFTMATAPRKFSTATPAFSTSRSIAMTTETSSLAVGRQLRWVTSSHRRRLLSTRDTITG